MITKITSDMISDNKLIYITTHLPPHLSAASIRAEKNIKYLSELGWEIDVITPYISNCNFLSSSKDIEKGNIRIHYPFPLDLKLDGIKIKLFKLLNYISRNRDKNHTNKINKRITSSRESYNRISDFLLIDKWLFWIIPCTIKVISIIIRKKHKIIYTSTPSPTCVISGLISSLIFNKRLVIEYRDLWTLNPFNRDYKNNIILIIKNIIERAIEKISLNYASMIVIINKGFKDEIYHALKIKESNKFIIIPNGYDPQDFIDIKDISKNRNNLKKNLKISHIGSLYEQRNIFNYIKAVTEYKDLCNINTLLIGHIDEKHKRLIKSKNNKRIKLISQVKHKESLDLMRDSDILLLAPGAGINTLTSKLFEYMYSQKPILCITKRNTITAKIITKYRLGAIADPDSSLGIYEAIKEIIANQKYIEESYKENQFKEYINRFNRRNNISILSKKLSKLNY